MHAPTPDLQVANVRVTVRDRSPLLPKVAFVLITLASLAGATLTGLGLGIEGWMLGLRWTALWATAVAFGFVTWRVVYLHDHEPDVDATVLSDYLGTAVARAATIARGLAILVAVTAPTALLLDHLGSDPWLRAALVVASVVLVIALVGIRSRALAAVGMVAGIAVAAGWGVADAGLGWAGLVRTLHLAAFGLWLGGATYNLTVAIPAGAAHPVVPAVVAGARQLQRFRWVVRFALPTVIATGLWMATPYWSGWTTWPAMLVPGKVGLVVALVVVFITCPLYRQCSPVTGVCEIDDLDPDQPPDDEPPEIIRKAPELLKARK